MPARWEPQDPAAIVRDYAAGLAPDVIGAKHGVTANPILRVLKEQGVPLRTRSQAEALKWKRRKLAPGFKEAARRQCSAGWTAAKKHRHADQEVAARARSIQRNGQTHGRPDPNEARIDQLLRARGVVLVRQLAVHRYNVDLGDRVHRFAVEVVSHSINRHYLRTFVRRTEDLLRHGWHVIFVDVTRGRDRAAIEFEALADGIAARFQNFIKPEAPGAGRIGGNVRRGRFEVLDRRGQRSRAFYKHIGHLPNMHDQPAWATKGGS